MTHVPVFVIISCLGLAFALPVLCRFRPRPAGWLVRALLMLNTALVARVLLFVNHQGTFYYHLGSWPPPWGIELSIDYLGLFTALVVHGVSLAVVFYAQTDLAGEVDPRMHHWYYTLFLLLLASMTGICFSGDFFNIFVFVEIATIGACGIIALKRHPDCVEASLKYLILSTLGSGLILLSLAILYMVTGHLNLRYIAQHMPTAWAAYPLNVNISLALLVVGFGVKAALFPLHIWLPDAHSSAPAPSSAILSGVLVKIYAVALIRLIHTVYGHKLHQMIPVTQVLLLLATLAIFAGSLFAIGQRDIKRMLAYSTVAQMGYIFLGVALLTENAVVGGVTHIFNHALMKSMLFMAAGAVVYQKGFRRISDFHGLGREMPITMAVFGIGALSMVGIPGFNGFISKVYLAIGALDAGRPVYVAVILISSLLNAAYYLPIVTRAFFNQETGPATFRVDRLPLSMKATLVILGGLCIYFGLVPGSLLRLVQKAVQSLLAT